jgi:biphenyl 2,3-dioxygenase beta subunit
MWVGMRRDRLKKGGEAGYLISERNIFLDQTVLLSKNLSNFF